VTREEAIKMLQVEIACMREFCMDEPEISEAYDMAIAALREQDVTDINVGCKWISVADKLPDGREDVLVVAFWHECWQPMIGWYSDMTDKWRIITPFGEKEPGGVTHWMPMPTPPEVEV
jgi:hypothetical protein